MTSYISLSEVELESKIEKLWRKLESCDLCGWKCGVNRLEGERGKCDSGSEIKINSAFPHYGEESVLVGRNGSGTIFLSNCSCSCQYCQNWQISQGGEGSKRTLEETTEIMLRLQERGCHNINWVTPTHFVPQLVKALYKAREEGLEVPVVYNTGGYDNPETIRALEGIIDIYMPDMKYSSNEMGLKYSKIPNYWTINKKAVKEMHRQVGDLRINEKGIAERGLLIRHLVLPNKIAGSEKVLEFISKEIGKDTFVNILGQYRPCWKADQHPELNRRITREELRNVVSYARKLDLNLLS